MLDTLRRLLPDSTAWRLVVDRLLKRYLTGVVSVGVDAQTFIDKVYDDIFPQTTRQLEEWQKMFGLPQIDTEQQQRDDLEAAWAAQGGQSPAYLQSILHAAGFTQFYVHDSFKQLSVDAAVPKGLGYSLHFPLDFPRGFDFGNGGEHFIFVDDGTNTVEHYRLNKPYSLVDGAVFQGNFALPETSPRDVRWKHGGDGFYTVGEQTDTIREFTMSTRWDVTTAVAASTLNTGTAAPCGIAISSDEVSLWVADRVDRTIVEYAMVTPGDLGTAIPVGTADVSSEDLSPESIEWAERGRKLYMLGTQNGQIYQYTPLTPYRVAGLVYDGVALDIATEFPSNADPRGLRLGGNLNLYISDLADKRVYEWQRTVERHNPRDYTNDPLFGLTQCGESDAQCGESQARCDRFLANEVWYLVNKKLTKEAPPKVPEDPLLHGHFWYVGGATFGDTADLPAADRVRFERLLLKLGPAEQWIVTLLNIT